MTIVANPLALLRMLPDVRAAASWRTLEGVFLFAIGVFAFFMLCDQPSQVFDFTHGPNWRFLGIQFVKYEIWAIALSCALLLADRAVDRGAPHLPTYTAAILAGACLGVVLGTLWLMYTAPSAVTAESLVQYARGAKNNLSRWLMLAFGAGYLYAEARRHRRTQARLEAAELDRTRKEKVALELRLQAMQARVEPQFLFNTLAHVKQLYESDGERADRVLDDLIAYLRAAMPRMREPSSTVRQETELAQRYLAILTLRLGDALRFSFDVSTHALSARMPPMMLLPLIDRALGESAAGATLALHVHARTLGGHVRVEIADNLSAFAPAGADAAIASLRERLHALYGEQAMLELRDEPGASRAVLELPLQSALEASAVPQVSPAPALPPVPSGAATA